MCTVRRSVYYKYSFGILLYRHYCIDIENRGSETPFSFLHAEGGGDGSGQRTAAELSAMGVPVTLVQDCAVGRTMPSCDLVLLGADGVAESGGVVNRVGTFQIAVVAKALGKPLYVAAESFKVHHSAVLYSEQCCVQQFCTLYRTVYCPGSLCYCTEPVIPFAQMFPLDDGFVVHCCDLTVMY